MIFDFRKKKFNPLDFPICTDGDPIENTHSYRYLGTEIDDQLSWGEQTKATSLKCTQRLYFLRKLKLFHVNERILYLFYLSVIQSTITHNIVVWYNNAKQKDTEKLHKIAKQASKIIKCDVDLDKVCTEKVVAKAQAIVADDSHPLSDNYKRLRSGRRWQSIRAKTTRYFKSFVPYSIRLMNDL